MKKRLKNGRTQPQRRGEEERREGQETNCREEGGLAPQRKRIRHKNSG
ncbi:MAG: hypothetical protein GX254_06010 [Clostridiales bacterium]|nr:hypothetical protein [Clostridiales bacterium]